MRLTICGNVVAILYKEAKSFFILIKITLLPVSNQLHCLRSNFSFDFVHLE